MNVDINSELFNYELLPLFYYSMLVEIYILKL